jgi:chromate transporter
MPAPGAAYVEIAQVFLRLGLTSFGGPVAHLGYFHEEIVRRRRWIGETDYADLVALCQFLPGPASSQVVFALGRHRGGLAGACLASLCFTLPSALLMIGFAYGAMHLGDVSHARWLHGLKLAAVAVVAQAVWTMGRRLCPDWPRRVLAIAAAAAVIGLALPAAQVAVIFAGALIGAGIYRRSIRPMSESGPVSAGPVPGAEGSRFAAVAALALFLLLLVALPLAAGHSGREIRLFDSFYRSGAFVFGGGHVVLPLLRAELIPKGWIGDDAFLAGYGAAQALPGPLFTFAAYLGTVIQGGRHAWLGGLICLIGLFLPGWLLVGGTLPFWHRLKRKPWAQAALYGANAVVVGLLLAALCTTLWPEAVVSYFDAAIVLGAFFLLGTGRIPVWAIVLICAGLGQWL